MKPEDIEYQAQQFTQFYGKRIRHYGSWANDPTLWWREWAGSKGFGQSDRDAILRAVLNPVEVS